MIRRLTWCLLSAMHILALALMHTNTDMHTCVLTHTHACTGAPCACSQVEDILGWSPSSLVDTVLKMAVDDAAASSIEAGTNAYVCVYVYVCMHVWGEAGWVFVCMLV